MSNLDLPRIWWRYVYPAEHQQLLRYASLCQSGGESWETSLRRAYQRAPETLHPGLVRLCKELGSRLFDAYVTFSAGDGATIITRNGRLPATVVEASGRSALVRTDEAVCRGYGTTGKRTLYLPGARLAPPLLFTKRADLSWRLRGSSDLFRLVYGRSYL
jgi:hypothetical protein